jgi:peptidoglycan/LPS O-acetylase OafA/YrhL
MGQLDGVRALAVMAVVIYHGMGPIYLYPGSSGVALGPIGVRVFFVVSGFLITGILLRARQSAAAAGVSPVAVWRAFVLRRAVRIFPLAYLAIGLAWIAGAPFVRAHLWRYLTYTSNLTLGGDVFVDPVLGHFWSLAIEEQFYLFWPIALLAVPRRWVIWTMVVSIVASTVARAGLLVNHLDDVAYVLTISRLDALAVGGVLAWWTMYFGKRPLRLAGMLLLLGIVIRAVPVVVPGPRWLATLNETGVLLASAALVLAAASGLGGIAGRALSYRPLVAIGTISYGVYVYHGLIAGTWPLVQSRFNLPIAFPETLGWARLAAMVMTTLPVAALSWRWFERPLNDLKARWPYVPAASPRPAPVNVPAGLLSE